MRRVHRNRNYKVNNNKHPQAINGVCAYKLLVVGPLTMKLGTLMYHDESSSKQKLQVCKQQQIASGNKYLYMVFVPIICLWLVL